MILVGDAIEKLSTLPAKSVHTCVTSPPYWGLRDYGVAGQLGLEKSPDEYVAAMVAVFSQVRRVLRDDGTLWLNLGDSYNAGREGGHPGGKKGISRTTIGPQRCGVNSPGLKPKNLVGIPWRVAFALQADGWYLRSDIIWHKPNPMPESVTDRPTKAHEYLFLFAKSERYFYDGDAVKEPLSEASAGRYKYSFGGPKVIALVEANKHGVGRRTGVVGMRDIPKGRNRRTVWTVKTRSFKGAHFATFPQDLIEPCIKAGCPHGGTVLDPFFGAGTTGVVASRLGRDYIGIELNPTYAAMATERIRGTQAEIA